MRIFTITLSFITASALNYLEQDIIMIRWNKRGKPIEEIVTLKGKQTNKNGFIVVCLWWWAWESCDYDVGGYGTFLFRDTNTAIALARGTSSTDFTSIIDIYGHPLGNYNPVQRYSRGRAVRKFNASEPSNIWDPFDWVVAPGKCYQEVGPDKCDPGVWRYADPGISKCNS